MKVLKQKKVIVCLAIIIPFVVGLFGLIFAKQGSSINVLLDYKYLVFFVPYSLFIFLHSFYMFRKNIKWASICTSLGLIYSSVLFLGCVSWIEKLTIINYSSIIEISTLCFVLLNTFFSYLFFGLAAKAYYKKPKRTTVFDLLIETFKKNIVLFINILIPLVIAFFCTILLGIDFFMTFTILMLLMIVIAILSGIVFSTFFYLLCLRKLG